MDDTYKISMQTPVGKKSGTIRLINDGGILSGYIKAMGNLSSFKNGTMAGNAFEFSGRLNAGFLQFDYHAKGTIEGAAFKAVASTNLGNFQISGTRIDG